MDAVGERLASLETWAKGHEKSCDDRTREISHATAEIKQSIAKMVEDSNESRRRLHTRFEDLANAVNASRASATAKTHALKTWALTGAVLLLLAVVGYLLTEGAPWQHTQHETPAAER